MRIAIFVGELVMHPVRRNPGDRPALERQRAANRKEILHNLFGTLLGPVRQQPVDSPIPIPKLQRNPVPRASAVKKAGQLKKKIATTAPIWNIEKAITLVQLIPSRFLNNVVP